MVTAIVGEAFGNSLDDVTGRIVRAEETGANGQECA